VIFACCAAASVLLTAAAAAAAAAVMLFAAVLFAAVLCDAGVREIDDGSLFLFRFFSFSLRWWVM